MQSPPRRHHIAITSPPPRHRLTSNQKGSAAGCLSSCPLRPRPRPLHSGGEEGQSKRASSRERRERTMAKDVADLFARSSPRLCSVCCPHRPHHRQPFTFSRYRKRKWKGGHLVRFWAMSSPHLATTSQPIDQQTATTGQRLGLSVILPASSSSPPLPPRLVGGEGREDHQPGRDTPSRSPCRPSRPSSAM